MRWRGAVALATATLAVGAMARAQDVERWSVTFETGAAWIGSNDVAIPGDTGTRFSMASVVGRGARAHFRLSATRALSSHTGLRLVVAPFDVRGTGVLAAPTQFAGASFAAGTPTRANYKFNSYRLTYWSRAHQDDRSELRVGGTLKIRDARVALRQGSTFGEDTDIGPVPLLYLAGDVRFAPSWRLALDFDGLAAPQGRAFDLSLRVERDLGGGGFAFVGYRMLEGGVDNDRVFNFAWVQYLTAGAGWRL